MNYSQTINGTDTQRAYSRIWLNIIVSKQESYQSVKTFLSLSSITLSVKAVLGILAVYCVIWSFKTIFVECPKMKHVWERCGFRSLLYNRFWCVVYQYETVSHIDTTFLRSQIIFLQFPIKFGSTDAQRLCRSRDIIVRNIHKNLNLLNWKQEP